MLDAGVAVVDGNLRSQGPVIPHRSAQIAIPPNPGCSAWFRR